MVSVNMHEAKTHLSRLVERATAGEEIVIAKAGKPMVRLTPVEPPARKRRELGHMRGQLNVPDNFNDPLPWEIQRYFEGEGDEDA
jgi:prevent-host-death family protein